MNFSECIFYTYYLLSLYLLSIYNNTYEKLMNEPTLFSICSNVAGIITNYDL